MRHNSAKKLYKLYFFFNSHIKVHIFMMIIIKFAKNIYSTSWNASNYAIFLETKHVLTFKEMTRKG